MVANPAVAHADDAVARVADLRVVGDQDECLAVLPIEPAQERQDQVEVGTPEQAVRGGADWIVVGRPITRAEDPSAAAREFLRARLTVETDDDMRQKIRATLAALAANESA